MEYAWLYPVASAVFLAGVAFLVWDHWWNDPLRRAVRALVRVPRSAICDAPDGRVVRLVGRVVIDGDALLCPTDDRRCAYFDAELRRASVKTDRRGNRQVSWRRVRHDTARGDFVVDDGTGRALVPIRDALLWVVTDREAFEARDADEAALLADAASRGALVVSGEEKWHTRVIAEGERVAVVGLVTRETDPTGASGGFRESPTRLVVRAPHRGRIQITDDPRASPDAG